MGALPRGRGGPCRRPGWLTGPPQRALVTFPARPVSSHHPRASVKRAHERQMGPTGGRWARRAVGGPDGRPISSRDRGAGCDLAAHGGCGSVRPVPFPATYPRPASVPRPTTEESVGDDRNGPGAGGVDASWTPASRASMRKVAERAGVAISSVSRVLSGPSRRQPCDAPARPRRGRRARVRARLPRAEPAPRTDALGRFRPLGHQQPAPRRHRPGRRGRPCDRAATRCC